MHKKRVGYILILTYLADGQWVWGTWSSCSKTCGMGTRTRSQSGCTGPFYAGMPCSGSGMDTETCQGMFIFYKAWHIKKQISLQLKDHGQPGVPGVHALQLVAQEHKVGPEVTLVECLVLVVLQMHRTAKVSL